MLDEFIVKIIGHVNSYISHTKKYIYIRIIIEDFVSH